LWFRFPHPDDSGYIDGLVAIEITGEKVDRLNDLMAELEGL